MLSVEKVNHDFGGRIILSDVSFRLKKGEHVALVGPNGEGKSTFLKIITNKLMPDEGIIKWSPKAKVGYLDQHAELQKGKSIRDVLNEAFEEVIELEKKMLQIYEEMANFTDEEMAVKLEEAADIQTTLDHSGYYMIDAKVEEVANGLGLGDIGLDKDVSELSGGQRTKVLLTKLLLQRPTILLLDEPTNFLDENHIEWLKRYLQEYENSFILISHDIPFINHVATVIYHIENGEFTRYTGNYDDFKRMYDIKKRQAEQAFEKQQKEIEKLEDFIARNKARVATRGMANSRQKKLDKMERIERVREKPKPKFGFRYGRASGKIVFEAKDLVLGYDEALTSPLNMTLERGKRIALKGVNGLGKSTLLKTLMGIIKPFDGKAIQGDYLEVGYFEQESDPNNSNTAIEEVWHEYPALTNLEVRAALAKCGLTNDHITSQMKVLSGGEAAKVRLCKLMLRDINLLVLDEPTNHLDVEAKEELKSAIKAFKGTLLVVSHEPAFYMDLVDDVWNVEDWTTKVI
ncbi:ABC-F family ATP-binding cassette domain-containing protein [Vallitalea pronyensis]|uniref:ABC-F family ATP-binding cassette domain-containing protein n=1 Tax=Vallitalea pronyensis TaxID=1348613 RepID=A0A8J8MMF3_9FIRM|nr:ABC-F family ATP-binding cassette domain-containing protein [Vallitalea pronyensis]QUI24154.1 ABC-F family ATP-binding cassette domain-containing protein [Vallitalea pronyensis]